ncbi:MAG TPA: hypothetical protein VFR08_01530 [Candidatus Angelobacter sp.]|nr:hypothetical protein [Candidatus Angelobacter sp.]
MAVAGVKRKVIALIGLAFVAGLAWTTLEAGTIRLVVMVVLGGFALRIALAHDRSRYDEKEPPDEGR